MITLDRKNGNGGLRLVETPQDIVPRLSRLETDDDTIISQLVRLGPASLERLFHLTENALVRLGGKRKHSVQSGEMTAPRIVDRTSSFGD